MVAKSRRRSHYRGITPLQELSNLTGMTLKVASCQRLVATYLQFRSGIIGSGCSKCIERKCDEKARNAHKPLLTLEESLRRLDYQQSSNEDIDMASKREAYEEIIWCLIAYPRSSAFVLMFSVSIIRYL